MLNKIRLETKKETKKKKSSTVAEAVRRNACYDYIIQIADSLKHNMVF